MRAAWTAVALLLLAGCANLLAQREAYLNTLVGMSEDQLVRTLGVPTRSFDSNGNRFLAYTESRIDVVPTGPVMGWGWGWRGPWGWGDAFPPEVVQRFCETTFEIQAGKVKGYTLRGNACG